MTFILDYFIRRPTTDSLSDLDHLFANTISGLPSDTQIGYCKRLIDRSRYDLDRTNKKGRTGHLKKLIRVAEIEIDRLSA